MSKQLILRLVLPLNIISFGIFTKWHYAVVIDGTDEFLFGFPFIQSCRGFHTSLSTQYFLLELLANFSCYFFIFLGLVFLLNKKLKFTVSKTLSRICWIALSLYFSLNIYTSIMFHDMYKWKRDFQVEIFDSGVSIMGQHPDYDEYSEDFKKWLEENNHAN